MYHVEFQVMVREVARLGRDGAISRATFDAWLWVLKEARPKRSLVLCSTEIDEYAPPGPFAFRVRFSFDVN